MLDILGNINILQEVFHIPVIGDTTETLTIQPLYNKRNKLFSSGSVTSLLKEVNNKGDRCDDPTGRHLGRGGPTNPPQKEQCGKTVHTVQAHWARGAKTRSPYDQ